MNAGPETIDVRLGERLRSARVARNLKQSDVAAALGLSAQQVQKYETGHNRITASRLVEIAGLLDVQPGDLLVATSRSPAAPSRLPSERGIRRLMEAWQLLPPRARGRLLELAEEMADLAVRSRTNSRAARERLSKNTEFL